ncbi:Protein kinase-like (PK-like) [Glarea lozoyensis ATCC 20868]|uniref:Protein kinase-like (PK-like) n=1 Tax=Glarea lozoyensis (strain ATCC 20868 / MF5171) TaxID=1116229 RepID=S3CFT2_GLAL2|nr:Protein kinase-like (PK-like) [Glarea lozoyensis ATCC 20868]EPE24109.1 Protein kinase-like (PK-like) [Glarea lozoyensis ATCC 20868]
MASRFRLGQLIKGKANTYTITKPLHECIWLATSSQNEQPVIIKSVRHFRLQNKRDILQRFQSRTSALRPLIDEIQDQSVPPAIVLKYLDDDLMRASAAKRLTTLEIKQVAKRVLEALNVLHEDGFVHTDIKIDNVLVNYGKGASRFTDVELADCGNTVHISSPFANDCDVIGAPVWRSPEAQLQISWGTPTDIWSLRTLLITLIYGDSWFIFRPDVPADHEAYDLKILMRHHQFFGPFPLSYQDIADDEAIRIIMYVMRSVPPEKMRPFASAAESEIAKEDKVFILRIMRLDPRDRPTAGELLGDEWFKQV